MNAIFAIDPGNVYSAYVIYYGNNHSLGQFGKVKNEELRNILTTSFSWEYTYAIEMVASYGMPVGETVFDTVRWAGRFEEIIARRGIEVHEVYRKEVKIELCGSLRAKDGNIRQAIIDRFPASGGGKKPTIGIKSNPGPLFGVSADVWAALGVALTIDAKLKLAASMVA